MIIIDALYRELMIYLRECLSIGEYAWLGLVYHVGHLWPIGEYGAQSWYPTGGNYYHGCGNHYPDPIGK